MHLFMNGKNFLKKLTLCCVVELDIVWMKLAEKLKPTNTTKKDYDLSLINVMKVYLHDERLQCSNKNDLDKHFRLVCEEYLVLNQTVESLSTKFSI